LTGHWKLRSLFPGSLLARIPVQLPPPEWWD
jgi:hypothetical protein